MVDDVKQLWPGKSMAGDFWWGRASVLPERRSSWTTAAMIYLLRTSSYLLRLLFPLWTFQLQKPYLSSYLGASSSRLLSSGSCDFHPRRV